MAIRSDKGDEYVPSAFGCSQVLMVVCHSTGVNQEVTFGQVCDWAVVPVMKKVLHNDGDDI